MAEQGKDGAYCFSEFQFDPREARLVGPHGQVHIGNKAIDVLEALIEQKGRLLSKEVLFETVWDGTIVSESALTSVIKELRRGLGDESKNPRFIESVYGRGYRFLPEVERVGASLKAPATALPLPAKPSVAVMPFTSLADGDTQDYFTDGMAIEIVTALSRFQSLFVISSGTMLSFRNDVGGATSAARELGVRYVLQGSVRKAGDRVRIAVELLDAAAHSLIWSQRFDGTLGDIFALQDDVANAVASQIEPSITANEVRRAAAQPTQDSSAYDLYLRGTHAFWEVWTAESMARAIDLYVQAAKRDPLFAAAHALASNALMNFVLQGHAADTVATLKKSVDYARASLRLGSDDAEVLSAAAYTLLHNDEPLATVDALIERALAQNLGISVCHYRAGYVHLYACRGEAAFAAFETALRLDPRTPWRDAIRIGQANALMQMERYEEALPIYASSEPVFPGLALVIRRIQAISYALMGQMDVARAIPGVMQPITPIEELLISRYRVPEFRARLRDTLELIAAGG
jgi:TolB-like protein